MMEKLKKKYLFLIIVVIIGIIVGILFSNILSNEDSKLVTNKITSYFNNLKDDVPINYLKQITDNDPPHKERLSEYNLGHS